MIAILKKAKKIWYQKMLHWDKTPVHQRRRPLISIERGSSLNEARCLTERKKQELIDAEMRREMELHELKKRKLEKDIEIIKKIKGEEVLNFLLKMSSYKYIST
ncbi:unnamed protein product [Acanthoscelides obtectus]|uniref:Uncharacterized protein n=1 Tax=Acanthoscelides obtectus TaxID=200917 RepID=A0A9P0QIG6_ACAOB|nr:unnamed protein product [Acanthoscelides obtectus]CAK1620066.1 hypothetical protein AOBTE_LOCUS170 [Acanthoscelides obtectus]